MTVTTGVSPRVCCALISGLSDGAGPARRAWARMMVPHITTCNGLQQVGTTSVQKAHGCRRLWSHQQADGAGGGTLGLCEPDLARALQTAPSVGPGGCQVWPRHRFRENVSGTTGRCVLSLTPPQALLCVTYILWALVRSTGSRFQVMRSADIWSRPRHRRVSYAGTSQCTFPLYCRPFQTSGNQG